MSTMYEAFIVAPYLDKQTGEEKTRWLRAGSAFENSDRSISVLLDALPVAGKLQLRLPDPDRQMRFGDRGPGPASQQPAKAAGGSGARGGRRKGNDDIPF